MTEDFIAAINWLKARPESTGRMVSSDSALAAPFRTRSPCGCRTSARRFRFTAARPRRKTCRRSRRPFWFIMASSTRGWSQAWPAYEAALKANNIRHEGYVYPKANHGFHNDTTPRYDEAAAKLAWQRTLGWFNKYLRA